MQPGAKEEKVNSDTNTQSKKENDHFRVITIFIGVQSNRDSYQSGGEGKGVGSKETVHGKMWGGC